MGPKYQVSRELDIPVGSENLFLPTSYTQDARELVVIVDTRSDRQRLVAAVGFSFLLMAAVSRMS